MVRERELTQYNVVCVDVASIMGRSVAHKIMVFNQKRKDIESFVCVVCKRDLMLNDQHEVVKFGN